MTTLGGFAPMKKFLELWSVGKTFGHQAVVEQFSLTMPKGEFVSIIGHSGCGKSTVLSMVAGLTPSDAGAIILDNREVTGPGADRGVVFQSPSLFPWMTAQENVLLSVTAKQPRLTAKARREIADECLRLVGLEHALGRRPAELSAGMRQRVGLARAFALSPKLLLLDEPFGMLDSLTRLELQDILLELLDREGLTALMVTHDVDEALYLSDRVVMMTSGPGARVGEVLTVPFARPRDRQAVLEHSDYYAMRERLIGFLEEQAQPGAPGEETTTPVAETTIPGVVIARRLIG
jgi:nitrate ABC transporter ATP-binding subunit